MSSLPHWEFRLVDTDSLVTIEYITKAWQRRFAPVYNRPGTFTTQVDITSAIARKTRKHSTSIVAERNGVVKWSGPVFLINDEADDKGGTTTITAFGWFEELNHRLLHPADEASAIFSGVAGGSIAMTLISLLRGQVDSLGRPSKIHIVPGTVSDVQTRIRSYKRWQNVGAAITELIDVENGMDIVIDPVTRTFNTFPPTAYADRPDVHLAFQIKPNNIAAIKHLEDGTKTANALNVIGNSAGISTSVDSPDDISEQRMTMEEVITLSDVGDAAIVAAYASSELLYRKAGENTLGITLKQFGEDPDATVLRLYDNFELGQRCYLSADYGRMQFRRHPVRIFAATIDVDDNGNEILSEIQVALS